MNKNSIDISETLKLLAEHKYEGFSYHIEVAKGLNKIPTTIKEGINQIRRQYKWLKAKK
jgi:hypothetical protein